MKFNNKKKSRKNKKNVKNNFFLILSGALIGMVNGMLGGGGGMICVPILEKVLKLSKKESHATAIAVIFPLSFVSALVYTITGQIEKFPFFIVIGVVVGGIIGSFVLKLMPPKFLRFIFAVVMFVGGIRLIL